MSQTIDNRRSRINTAGTQEPPAFGNHSENAHHRDHKATSPTNYSHPPWLLRRTSVTVESTPADYQDDASSEHVSINTNNDEKKAVRNLIDRFGRRHLEFPDDKSSIAESKHGSEHATFGTTVSIEASKPKTMLSKKREMQGLADAASLWRWNGTNQPGEAWGKLAKDPELWDSNGDTLIYFGYQRPEASFRVKSSMLEATQSDFLISKLQDGYQRNPKSACASPIASPTSPSVASMRNLSINGPSSSPRSPKSEFPFPSKAAQIHYQIHFPPPDDASKQEILRCHATTRNFFALLMNKPLVGLTFYQALVDLQERLQQYLPTDANSSEIIIDYLQHSNTHNIANDPAAAAGLLAWSEDHEVRWREGWREGFVHCCGMYTQIKQLPEYRDISHSSRSLLERSYLQMQSRLRFAEEKLLDFDFDDIWAGSEVQLHPSRAIFDQFRRFLQQWYGKCYKRWPPKPQEGEQTWFTRPLASQLQMDFGAIYDYVVDRCAVWTQDKAPEDPNCAIVSAESGENLETNRIDICLAKLLTRYDQRRRQLSIPHPFPLLPAFSQSGEQTKKQKSRFFSSKGKSNEKDLALAYLEASNSAILDPKTKTSKFLDAFVRFERTDDLRESDARDARRARWILLYGALQVLGSITVDMPGLNFTEGVNYFLCPRLKGAPPWRHAEGYEEASPRDSYCWIASGSWGASG